MAFIQGYLAELDVDGVVVNIWSSQATLSKTTNAIPNNTLGKTHNEYLNGKKDTAMTVTMHLDTDALVLLQAADDAVAPVVCKFRPGNGTKDAGSYTGAGIITSLDLDGGAEDNWSVALTIQGTAEWPYTAPI